jgi:uncharacterized protein YjbI with pentapeptide repeats
MFAYAHLTHADLRGADLKRADLRGADFKRADLRGADFTGADLRKAVLADVCFDDTTKWGSNRPPASSSC